MNPEQFFNELWGEEPPGNFYLFTLPNARTFWPENIAVAARMVPELAEQFNVYTGVSLGDNNVPRTAKTRVKNNNANALAGLWIDIDIADPSHKKPNLPPDLDVIFDLLDEFVPPTIVIDSGHGIHCWWLFERPQLLQNDTERETFARLAQWWQGQIRSKFVEFGFDVDATHDFSRVLRVPGTWNHNGATTLPVETIREDGPRQSVTDWLKLKEADDAKRRSETAPPFSKKRASYVATKASSNENGFSLSPDANPNAEKLVLLFQASAKARASWEHRRNDLTDQSLSAYDLSLASIAVQYGWSDQEIVDLVIAHRRKHGGDLKLRQDYHQRTIGLIHQRQEQSLAESRIEDLLFTGGESNDLLEEVSQAIGIRMLRIIRYLGDPPLFWIETPVGSLTVNTFLDRIAFRNTLANATKHLMPEMSKKSWNNVAKAMLQASIDVDLGDPSDPHNEAQTWLTDYLLVKPPTEDFETQTDFQDPFVKDGVTYIFLDGFRTWVDLSRSERISAKDMARRLRMLGWAPKSIGLRTSDGQRRTLRCWTTSE